ncbi:MAG: hypothetical protein ACK41E_05460 [Deinococcales bacterium]
MSFYPFAAACKTLLISSMVGEHQTPAHPHFLALEKWCRACCPEASIVHFCVTV